MKRKRYLMVIFTIILAVIVLLLVSFKDNLVSYAVGDTEINKLDYSTEIGENAYVSSAAITERKTGVGPYDSQSDTDSENSDGTVTWTAGDDISANDNIVRSFDQITWTIDNILKLKSGTGSENYHGGVIEFEATVPENLGDVVEWDVDSMIWAEDIMLSNNGTKITGYYSLSESEITVPGEQSLVFVLAVNNAINGTEINAEFKLSLYGNDEDDVFKIIDDDTVYVSAAGRYNIAIAKNSYLDYRSYFDLESGKEVDELTDTAVNGRMEGYGIVVQLYNNTTDKELKGIELPQGDLEFDIELSETTSSGGDKLTDPEYKPILWDYNENMNSTNTGKWGRNIYWANYTATRYYNGTSYVPYNKNTNRVRNYCYDGGTWTIEQKDDYTYHVTIKDYVFDTEQWFFPSKPTDTNGSTFGTYIGCFSAGYIQVVLQFPESVENVTSLYLKVNIDSLNVTSMSGRQITEEIKTSDSYVNSSITLYPAGSIVKQEYIQNSSGTHLWSAWGAGDSSAGIGQTIRLATSVYPSASTDYTIRAVNVLQKFDDTPFEIPEGSDGSYGSGSNSTQTVFYAAKPDKTGWANDEEMIEAKEEDLIYFETIDELNEKGYTCIGVLFELRGITLYPRNNVTPYIPVTIKQDSSLIGNTYCKVSDVRAWIEDIDFSWIDQEYTYDDTNGLIYNIIQPTSKYHSYTTSYVKTEYDENGQIVSGTHSTGYQYGNTVLITGATPSIEITTIDEETGEAKTNYDVGKNDYDAFYKVSPKVTVNSSNGAVIENVTLSVKVTLPDGLTYEAGSCNYGEPEITENSDGTTTLVWYIYGYNVGDEIEPITFYAHINEETDNNTQYEVDAMISEVIADDEQSKIGNTRAEDRTASTNINIINLSSYSFYKTTETPVIEIDGEVHYKITILNKTDNDVDDFQLLDVLPYNGDGRGTSFHGTYKVEQIVMTQTSTTSKNEIENELNLYITNSEDVRDKEKVNVKDTDLGLTSIWSEVKSGDELMQELTGYAVTGVLKARERLEVDIYLKTDGNESYDSYKNVATAQTNKETDEMETSIITVQDVKRIIEGYVWYDKNDDGLISDDEEYLSNVKVELVNSDGTTAKNVDGDDITAVYTDEDGYYKFEDMVRGNYIVKIVGIDGNFNYRFTEKEVGSNVEINSKVNENGQTDVIESLNSVDSPVIIESYVNAGVVLYQTFRITKVDEENKALEGAKFEIENVDTGEKYTLETDENGEIVIDLEFGEYIVKEVETVFGHKLNKEIYNIVVDSSGIYDKRDISAGV